MHPYRTSDSATELGFIDDREEGTAPLWEETNGVETESGGGVEPESDEELPNFPQTPSKKRKRRLDALVAARAARAGKRQKK